MSKKMVFSVLVLVIGWKKKETLSGLRNYRGMGDAPKGL